MNTFFILTAAVSLVKCSGEVNDLKFPKGFMFGTSTSAYQTEGAWNISDKSPSIWDNFVHNHPEKIMDGSTGDVACDSYKNYETDISILHDLKVHFYRFSLSWTRLLPKGHRNYVSKDGLSYYTSILDELERKNITPLVTIYHWDHPQILEEMGGWLSETMVDLFADYADFVFDKFAHRVKYFVTVNEPQIYCSKAYTSTVYPPAQNLTGTGDYLCVHNMLKAHAMAYEIYNEKYRSKYHGKVGTSFQCKHFYNDDTKVSDLAFDFECGWQAHPIFSSSGDYPMSMKKKVAERSTAQGYKTSRLPVFNETWIEKLKDSADFFGLNYYTSQVAEQLPNSSMLDWPNDEGLKYSRHPNGTSTEAPWLKIVPDGLERVLKMIRDKYNNPLVLITENGMADANSVNDDLRIDYLHSHLKAVLSAINDGCNVTAHTVWSLLDNFEWRYGYKHHFGLVNVDFNSKNKTRTLKKSAYWYRTIIETHQLQPINKSRL